MWLGTSFRRIAERFAHQVKDKEAAAGRDLFLYRRVRFLAADVDRLAASMRVAGDRELEVRLTWKRADEGIVEASCPCRAARRGQLCRHLWAAILLFEKREGRIPGDETLTVELTREEVPWPEAHRSSSLRSGLLSHFYDRRFFEKQADREEGRNDWGDALRDIQGELAPRPRRLEVHYHLDVSASRVGRLHVQLYQRAVRKTGRLGNVKSLKLSEADALGLPDPADREILPLLIATASTERIDARYDGYPGKKPRRYGVGIVPSLAYRTALPLLCATTRFYWIRGDYYHTETVELAWDDEPWRFVLGVERHEELGEGRVHGILERGKGEGLLRRPLAEADLVLANGLALVDGTFSPLHTGKAGPWIERLLRGGDLLLPLASLTELIDELAALPSLPPLVLPPDLDFEQIRAVPRRGVTCRVRRREGRESRSLDDFDSSVSAGFLLEPFFVYDGLRVAASEPPGGIVDRGRRRMIERDLHFEQQAVAELVESGPVRPVPFVEGTYQLALRSFSPVVTQLLERGWTVEAEGRRVRRATGTPRFKIKSRVDWFGLDGEVDFDGAVLPVPELLRAIRRGERLVLLGDGTHGMLPEEWLERYGPVARIVGREDGFYLRRSQAAVIDLLLAESEEKVDADQGFKKLRQRLRSFAGIAPQSEPEGFTGELRPYQREGLAWLSFLRELGFGGCLADDMGLGKTVQVLALLALDHLASEEERPSLAVVPKSLVANWVSEARRFTPELSVVDLTAVSPAERGDKERLHALLGAHHLAVTTYGLLRRDVLLLREVDFAWVLLDEAQAIKNFNSQAARASRALKARQRLALTGTPVENHLGELGSLFEFLNPGIFGSSKRLLPELLAAESDQVPMRLVRALRPFLLRRTKEEVLPDLPPKTEQTLYVELDGDQRELYDELREHYRMRLDQRIQSLGLGQSKLQVLEALLRLRQAACHPGLIDESRAGQPSAKLDLLLEQLEEVLEDGHKTLVFSQFVKLLSLVRRELDERGIPYEYLDGSTRNRAERVARFQNDGGCRLFLISLKAGGLGLNLTAADYVFLLDPWWNPAVEAQAVDRAHRIGQERPVFAYRLVARDTVEEKILTLQQTKRRLADAILTGSAKRIADLTAEDLEVLFS